jgi:hypothetical protein
VVACAKPSLRDDAGATSPTSRFRIRWPDEHVLPTINVVANAADGNLLAETVALAQNA